MDNNFQSELDKINRLNKLQNKKINKLQAHAENQRKMLGLCLAVVAMSVGLTYTDKMQDLSPDTKDFVEKMVLALVTGAGGIASTTVLSSSKQEEDEEEES